MSASISSSYQQQNLAYQAASEKQTVVSTAFSATASVEVTETEEAPKQTLEEFKKEFAKFVGSLPIHPSQAKASQSVSIHDNVFKKMMEDPDYKTEVEDMVRESFAANFSPGDPAFCTMRLDANGEYRGTAGGSFHMDKFAAESADAVWKKDVPASSRKTTDDSFFGNRKVKSKASRKKEQQEKLLEQLSEKRRQQQEYLQNYFANKSLFGTYQTAAIPSSTQTGAASIFDSLV